jgi:DNA-binding MarR family transcriptional regulator
MTVSAHKESLISPLSIWSVASTLVQQIPRERMTAGYALARSFRARPRRITELAVDEHVTQPAITLLVNRLQQRGWVQRIADPSDGRAVLVSLTSARARVAGMVSSVLVGYLK